jgi:hypothetical protein
MILGACEERVLSDYLDKHLAVDTNIDEDPVLIGESGSLNATTKVEVGLAGQVLRVLFSDLRTCHEINFRAPRT